MFKLNNGKRYLIVILFVTFNLTHGQAEFAFIKKNVNVLAEQLDHDLNSTKDTLILSSPAKIYRVYTIGTNKGAVDNKLLTNNFKVPLTSFNRGKYVFIVDQLRYKIIFTIFVLRGKDLLPGEFLTDTAIASNLNENVEPVKKAIIDSKPLLIKTTELIDKTEEVTVSSFKNEHHSKSVFENWDLLNDAAKLTNPREPRKSISKFPISKNIRTDILAQVVRSSSRTKKSKELLLNPNDYNLTDINRDGIQSRLEARKLMAIKRQKIRDSIKKRIKNQK